MPVNDNTYHSRSSVSEKAFMYVCLCQGVTDREIREAADNGVNSMRQLGKELGVGRQCGRCACSAREILRESRRPDYLALANLLAQPA